MRGRELPDTGARSCRERIMGGQAPLQSCGAQDSAFDISSCATARHTNSFVRYALAEVLDHTSGRYKTSLFSLYRALVPLGRACIFPPGLAAASDKKSFPAVQVVAAHHLARLPRSFTHTRTLSPPSICIACLLLSLCCARSMRAPRSEL